MNVSAAVLAIMLCLEAQQHHSSLAEETPQSLLLWSLSPSLPSQHTLPFSTFHHVCCTSKSMFQQCLSSISAWLSSIISCSKCLCFWGPLPPTCPSIISMALSSSAEARGSHFKPRKTHGMAVLLSEVSRKNKQASLLYFYDHNHQVVQLLSWYMLLEEQVLNDSGDNDFLL